MDVAMLPFLVAMKCSFELHGFIDLTEAPDNGTSLLSYGQRYDP